MADIDIQKLFCIFISFHWNCDYLQVICITMTLQWAAVAFFLYAEIGLNLILCIPFISAKRYCSITHIPSVRVSCHCCPFLTVIRLTVFLSSVMQLAFGFPLENMEVVVSILEQMLLHYDYGFDRSFTGWVLLTDCPHRQHHFTLLLDLRCCTRGAEVLRAWASARRQSKPECLWPCAHEAFQSSEELVHIWLLSLPLAVSVPILRLVIILLNC